MHNKHSMNSFNNYAVKFPIPKYELRGWDKNWNQFKIMNRILGMLDLEGI